MSESDFQWGFPESADFEDRKPEDVAFVIHLLHHLVARGLQKVTWVLIKNHLEVIPFGIVANPHFSFGHR